MWHKVAMAILYIAGAIILTFFLLIIASRVWKKYKKDKKHLREISRVVGASLNIRSGYGEFKRSKYRFYYPSLKHNSLNLEIQAKSPIKITIVKKGFGKPIFTILKKVAVNDLELDSEYLFYSSNIDVAHKWLENLAIKDELIGVMNSGCYKLEIRQSSYRVYWKRLSQLELKYLPEWVGEAIDKLVALKNILFDDIKGKNFTINPPLLGYFIISLTSLISFLSICLIIQPIDVNYILSLSAMVALPLVPIYTYKIVSFSFRTKRVYIVLSISFNFLTSISVISSFMILSNSLFLSPKPKYVKVKKVDTIPFFGDVCFEILELESGKRVITTEAVCIGNRDNLDVKIYKGRFNMEWADVDIVASKLSLIDIYSTLESGDIDLALKFADKYIELNEEDMYGYYARGKIYFKLKLYQKALSDMKKSLNIDKHQIDIYLMVDKILSAMKRHDEIISYWSRYIELEPNSARAYYERAKAYLHSKNLESAKKDLSRACELGADRACSEYKKLFGSW
jgi:tetratricopeptide (TPR) repeat protein